MEVCIGLYPATCSRLLMAPFRFFGRFPDQGLGYFIYIFVLFKLALLRI